MDRDEKVVLCFGDSNTWGYMPATGSRYPHDIRWPGVMEASLGPGYRVIEEGLCARTTAFEDHLRAGRRGDGMLGRLCESHCPLDLVIIMLGTNDCKYRCGANPWDIAKALEKLALIAKVPEFGRDGRPPRILLVCPPPIEADDTTPGTFQGAGPRSRQLPPLVADFARSSGAAFLDAGRLIAASPVDGVHLEPEAHRTLGLALAGEAKRLLEELP